MTIFKMTELLSDEMINKLEDIFEGGTGEGYTRSEIDLAAKILINETCTQEEANYFNENYIVD
jgi:hypothetical protein